MTLEYLKKQYRNLKNMPPDFSLLDSLVFLQY
nr:MAG TPA: hypothetical protein [Caudoviricetes sp.]